MSHNPQIWNKIRDIFDKIGIDYVDNDTELRFPCPIHQGRDKNACVYIGDGYCSWKCYSYNCHEEHKTVFKLLMVTLNKNYEELLIFLKQFDITQTGQTSNQFVRTLKTIKKQRRKVIPVNIPTLKLKDPDFYINRGFQKSTLQKFEIGTCKNKNSIFYNHIVVPVKNDNGKIAGIIARNPYPKCIICGKYHQENDPCSKNGTKWKNTKGFFNNAFLYNLNNAKPYIKQTQKIILVESVADVWRMYEAGIYNTVGLFGTSVSIDQQLILESLPITEIILFLDPDEAGIQSQQRLKNKFERLFTVKEIQYSKQPADCSIEELKRLFNV